MPVKNAKLKDVDRLLSKHFGNEWRSQDELQYYREVMNFQCNLEDETICHDEEEHCYHNDIENFTL